MHFIRVGTIGVVYIVGVLSISVKLKISPVKLTISIVQLIYYELAILKTINFRKIITADHITCCLGGALYDKSCLLYQS